MLKQNPYHLLLITSILLLFFSLFDSPTLIDINVSDTFFVFPMKVAFRFVAIFFLALWLVYTFTAKIQMSKKLTWCHVLSTVFSASSILIIAILFNPSGLAGKPRRYYDDEFTSIRLLFTSGKIIRFFVSLLLAAQILFIVNLSMAIYKRIKTLNR